MSGTPIGVSDPPVNWARVRLPSMHRENYVKMEVWLLSNIGPGTSGPADLLFDTDLWLYWHEIGYPTVWFKHPTDSTLFERMLEGQPDDQRN